MADAEVVAGVSLDPGSANLIAETIGRAIREGLEKGLASFGAEFSKVIAKSVPQLGQDIRKSMQGGEQGFKEATQAAAKFDDMLSKLSRDTLNIARALKELGQGTNAVAAAISRESQAATRSSVETNQAAARASNERLVQLRNGGKLAAIEAQRTGQLEVTAAREAGRSRVAITQGVVNSILKIEKGLGTTLSGIARTSVGAVSKVFDTLKGAVSRSDKSAFSSTTLERSLKERESEIRSSYSRQERTVRESITRQEAAITGLRASTQKGVIGSANRSGLFGGLALGFGALAAIKSTFTVGADFARGLSTLQASLDLTDGQMKKVRQTSIDLGNDISLPGVSALDAAQAIQVLTKQFGSLGPAAVDAAQAAAKGTLQLARASGASAEDAGALIGAAVNVFGIAADDAVSVADKMAGALTRAAGVGFADFKDSFVQGAAVFHQFVGPTESANDALLDFNTTLAILAKNGITGSNAGAGLKQFFIQATQNTKSASKASAELAKRAGETGNVFFQASGKLRPFNESVEILRKGVEGLSDQARTNVLGDLFGSRSITIANALINSGAESFGELRIQIAKAGLAAKIAAAQNTGLKGALDALSSVAETLQIIFFEKVNKPLGNAVLAITNFANTVLFGASPAMHTLRIALIGVASGLGALLALKTAVEVISLLGKAAALALTPMGGLALLFAGVGTAIALLSDSNDGFVDSLLAVRDKAVAFGRDLLDKVQPVVEQIVGFVRDTAIPTLKRWADIVGRDLVGAFNATVGFITDTVIPGIQRFVGALRDDVFPVVAEVAGKVATGVLAARDAVVGVARDIGRTVAPFIAPAVQGFRDLGGAIADFVTGGGFGRLGSGFAAAGSGIASSAVLVGSAILDALKPIAATVLNFFKDVFSVKNLFTAVDSIGEFLNFVGEKVGQFISNPKFIAGVAIVAAALVKVGATWALSLARGLGEGILDNVPRLFTDVVSAIGKVLSDPKLFATVAIGAALVGTLGPSLIRAFRSIGEGGATGLVTGLKTKLSGAGGFATSLFNGPDLFGNFGDQAKAVGREVDLLQNKARALGLTKVYDRSTSGLAEIKGDLAAAKAGLTNAQIAGLEFRDKMSSAFKAVGGVFRGGAGVLGGITDIATSFVRAGLESGDSFMSNLARNINAGGSKVKAGFTTIVDSLRTYAAEQGTTMGKLVAGGLAKGLAGATAGIALGAQVGTGDGLSKILGLAGLAGTAVAIGGPLGVATGAVGLLSAAFFSSRKRAEEYQQAIKGVTSAISPALADAAKNGQISLAQLRDGLDFKDVGKTDVFDKIKETFVDSLSGSTLKTLRTFGVSFTDQLAPILKSGGGLAELSAGFLNAARNSTTFAQKFKGDAGTVAAAIAEIIKPGGATSLEDLDFKKLGFTTQQIAAVTHYHDEINQLVGANNDLAASYDKNAQGLKAAGDKQFALTKGTKDLVALKTPVTEFFAGLFGAGASSSLDNAAAKAEQLKSSLGVAFASSDSARTSAIDDVNTKLQKTIDIKTQIDSLFSEGVLPAGVTSTQAAINNALIAVDGLGKRLEEISNADITPQLKTAQTESALAGFSRDIGTALSSGIKDHTIVDAATASAVLQPIVDQAKSSTTSQEIKDGLQAAFDHIITTFSPTIDQATAATQAQAYLDTIKSILENAPPISVPVAVELPKTLSVADATFATDVLNAAGVQAIQVPAEIKAPVLMDGWEAAAQALVDTAQPDMPIPVLPNVSVPAGFDAPAITAATTAGQAIDTGMARGINTNSGVVSAAARTVASNAVQAAKAELGIQSPSKVFERIGKFMIEGMQVGIEEAGGTLVDRVKNLVDRAVESATGAVSDAQKALRGGTTSLFDALFGSSSAQGKSSFGGLQAGITESFNSLGSTLDSSFERAADVLKRSATEKLGRAELDVLGEQGNSLNPNDVLGAANRGALISSIDDIVGLGKSLIEQGTPASEVTATMQAYLDRLRALSAQYGLDVGAVDGVIQQMGLGRDALDGFVTSATNLATILGQVNPSAQEFNDKVAEIFKTIRDGGGAFKSIQGVGAAEDARAAVTGALAGIAAAADANDQRAQQILDKIRDPKKNGPLTFADQLAFNQGLNGRDINTTDQFGIANRKAFEDAIGKIGDMAQALIDGGSAADYVTGQVNEQVNALIAYGTSLGFNSDQILDLVNKAGLGAGSLAAFNQAVADAQKVSQQAADAKAAENNNNKTGPRPNGDLPPISNTPTDATVTDTLPGVTINQYLPYADPAAIALAAANGVASAVRLPV